MTIHAAKGLEFNYVFIANLVDKRFPTIERREPIAIPDALVKEILPEGDIHLEEERRLFYVAMTRARKHLYFSWAPDYGGVRLKKPSRFLGEIGLVKGGQKDNGQTRKKEDSQFTTNSRAIRAGKEDYKLPFYLSYSQLSLFEDCPYKYRFSYILKVPTRGKHFFSFGETMHLTLEEVFRLVREKLGLDQDSLFRAAAEPIKKKRKAKISLEEVIGFYEKNWIDDWYESAAQKDEYKKLGRKVLKEFLELNENNWPETILLEKNFNFKIDAGGQSYSIRGRIDRVDKVGDKVKIIDYKTGRPKKKLETSDKEQLLIYQLALEDIFKYEVGSLAFYYLEDNSEIEFLGGLKELSELKEKIIRTIENINQGEFPPKPGPLCQYCDYKEICEFKKSK